MPRLVLLESRAQIVAIPPRYCKDLLALIREIRQKSENKVLSLFRPTFYPPPTLREHAGARPKA